MANARHIRILRSGVAGWNSWRAEHPSILPNLATANLSTLDLRDANLCGACLDGADLTRAKLDGAQCGYDYDPDHGRNRESWEYTSLRHANLTDASIQHVNFEKAELGGACFRRSTLRSSSFMEATLLGAVLDEADVTDCSFLWASFGGTSLGNIDLSVAKHLDDVIEERMIRKQSSEKRLVLIPLNLDNSIFSWQHGKASVIRGRLAADFACCKEDLVPVLPSPGACMESRSAGRLEGDPDLKGRIVLLT